VTINYRPIRRVDYLIVHCSATTPDMDVGRAEIERWHRERGFFAVGYHYVVRRDGTVEKGRPEDQPGAHAVGYNEKSIGVCLVGGVEHFDKNRNKRREQDEFVARDNFTPAQKSSLATLLKDLKARYPQAAVLGHRDLPPRAHGTTKECPGFDVRAWWASQQ
jgi:N-acetyl-anhydromuramyl-L-alanine amidase AmpD